MSQLFRLRIVCAEESAIKIAGLLSETGVFPATAVSWFENSRDGWCVDSYYTALPDTIAVQKFIQSELAVSVSDYEASLEAVDDTDWVQEVQSQLAPVSAGRFLIYGSHDREKIRENVWTVEIDAGQAFGTAHHGTTRGCLLALDYLLKKKRLQRVVDIGTGSGILAICVARAAKFSNVIGIDIDPISVCTAKENCGRNDVGPLVRIVLGDGLNHNLVRQSGAYDLIMANILSEPLKRMATDISSATCAGGYVVLSGLLDCQVRGVLARYIGQKFALERVIPLEGWTTLILRKRLFGRSVNRSA